MIEIKGTEYTEKILHTISEAWNSQQKEIQEVVDLMVETIKSKHSIFMFGCSHAGIIAEEMFYRTGGLALINPIFFPGFMLNTRPVTLTSKLERVDGIASALLKENHVTAGDFLLIHSVSGRNNVPIEMAIEAKKMGVHVVAVTNVAYSSAVTSRHPGGKNLYELADIVLDNKGDFGDASIRLSGFAEAIGPTSTAVAVSLLNGIVVEVVEKLLDQNDTPPVFLSANVDGGDEHNQSILEKYKDNIFYM